MEQLKSGIYQIQNKKTKDIYIGSSVNIHERWNRHKRDLRNGKHHSRILQRAYEKYGNKNFYFSVLEYCLVDVLCERENYYLENKKPIYNIYPRAYSLIGRKLSDEHKEKLRAYAIKNKIKPPNSTYEKIRKKICMLDKNNSSELKWFESISEACIYIGKTNKFVNTLSKVCTGKRKSAFGYKWKFE